MTGTAGKFPADIRRAAGVSASTPMQVPIHPDLVSQYLGNARVFGQFNAHRVGGLATRMQDVREDHAAGVLESHGLDVDPRWPSEGPAYLMRFYAHNPALFVTPYGGRSTESAAARFEAPAVYREPFLGTGYTPSRAHVVPEFFMPYTEIPAGAELYRADESDKQTLIARYPNRQIGWVSVDQDRSTVTPAPLRLTVRRGLFAQQNGQEFEADYGPRPGHLVLHPMPGTSAPDDFTDERGARFKKTDDVELDEIASVRQACTWRGGSFEVLDVNGTSAALNFLGENQEQAEQLGLVEVSYRIWQAVVPRTELTDVRETRTVIPVQGQFGGN